LPIGQANLLGVAVDLDCARAQPQVDGVLVVERLGLEGEAVGVGLALQPGLGQRRPLVGRQGLLADQSDRPLEAVLAQQGRRGAAAVPRAQDDNMGRERTVGIGCR